LFADLARQDGRHPSAPAEVVGTIMVLQALQGLSDTGRSGPVDQCRHDRFIVSVKAP
jgi:hypothetical protein